MFSPVSNTPSSTPDPTPPASPQSPRRNQCQQGPDGSSTAITPQAGSPARSSPFQEVGAVAAPMLPPGRPLAATASRVAANTRAVEWDYRRSQRLSSELHNYVCQGPAEFRRARMDLSWQFQQLPEMNVNGGNGKRKVGMDQEIGELPPNFSEFQSIRQVEFTSAGWTRFPDEILSLTQLTDLTLHSTGIQSLPPEIGDLRQLTNLTLSGRSIQSLPPEIGDLRQLTNLTVTGTSIQSLPPEIGDLRQLTNLTLSGSSIQSLPPEIGDLRQLTNLTVAGNGIQSLPPEIGDLRQLTNLTVTGTGIQSLPVSIQNCTSITTLNLQENSLSHLPNFIGEFDKLTDLTINNNQLHTLPESLGQPNRALNIIANNNPLTSLPRSLMQLGASSCLRLSLGAMSDGVRRDVINMFDYSEAEEDRTTGPLLNFDMGWGALRLPHLAFDEVVDRWFGDATPVEPGANALSGDRRTKVGAGVTAPSGVRDMELSAGVTDLLNGLRSSPLYANRQTRTVFAERVTNLLEQMLDSRELRERLDRYARTENPTATCIDRVAVGFNTMEMMARHHLLERSGSDNLDEVATHLVGAHRVLLVEQAAGEEIQRQRRLMAVDDVEVLMHIQTALREPLNLPINMTAAEGMFLYLVDVSQERLDAIRDSVLAASGTPQQQAEILAQDSAWRACVERRLAAEGTSVEAQIQQHAADLETRYEGRNYDAAYDLEINRIGSRPYVEAALQALGQSASEAGQNQDVRPKDENRSKQENDQERRGDDIPVRNQRNRSPSPPPGAGASTLPAASPGGGSSSGGAANTSSTQSSSNRQQDVRPRTQSATNNTNSIHGPYGYVNRPRPTLRLRTETRADAAEQNQWDERCSQMEKEKAKKSKNLDGLLNSLAARQLVGEQDMQRIRAAAYKRDDQRPQPDIAVERRHFGVLPTVVPPAVPSDSASRHARQNETGAAKTVRQNNTERTAVDNHNDPLDNGNPGNEVTWRDIERAAANNFGNFAPSAPSIAASVRSRTDSGLGTYHPSETSTLRGTSVYTDSINGEGYSKGKNRKF